MTHRKYISKLLISTALLLPIASHASSAREALEACATRLSETFGEDQGHPVDFAFEDKMATLGPLRSTAAYWSSYVFHLDAVNPKTSEIVARADCRVGANSKIVKFETLPLPAQPAEARKLLSAN